MPVVLNDTGMRRVLIGTVGYHNLRDYSLGPKLLPELKKMNWPDAVAVEEMNWGPIAIVQDFQSSERPYDRVVLISARPSGRPVGTITLRRWLGGLPGENKVQARVAEAVTGVISVDNLLVIGEYFGIWPGEVILVDVEPGREEMGESFTPEVQAVIPEVLRIVQCAATRDIDSLGKEVVTMRGTEL